MEASKISFALKQRELHFVAASQTVKRGHLGILLSHCRYYEVIMVSLCFVLPVLLPVFAWSETWFISVHAMLIRYVWSLHATFIVNSFAHMWGNRPYNRQVLAPLTPRYLITGPS